jgi:hypothetical protein
MDQLPDLCVLETSMTNAADEMRKIQNLPVVNIGAQPLQMHEQMRRMEARVGERLNRTEQNILGHLRVHMWTSLEARIKY